MILSWESADQSSLALGILNEAVEQISRHTDRASFWRAVCQNSRWIIPGRRMCALLVRSEGHQVVARFEQGEFLPVPDDEAAALSVWVDRTQRARWVQDLGLEPGACPTCDWLTDSSGDSSPNENAQVLLVPVPGQDGIAARLLYFVPGLCDAAALVSIARIYAHHVGMAYRMLETVDRLRKSEARLATIFQQSGEGLVLHDLNGRVLEANRRFCDLVGLSPEELRAMPVTQLTPEPAAETGRHALETVVNDGFCKFETELLRGPRSAGGADDRFLAAITATRINTEDGAIVQAVVRDVTEERRLTRELEQARDRAEAANRAKSEFLASMSHEIRTPMNAILGMSELLGESELSAEQAEYVRVLNKSGTALLVLINDVLDLARIESGRVELEELAFDPRDIGRNVYAMLQMEARRKNLRFDLELGDALPRIVYGDTHRIQQILLNLGANAVKFTDAGSVRIKIRPTALNSNAESAERIALEFEVIDTGIGIPDASKAEIFESFSQVDRSITRRFGGTGLGLAIAAHLVRMMDGRIAVRDNPGGGSIFRFQLQLAAAGGDSGHSSAQPPTVGETPRPDVDAGTPAESQLRILLVDDSEDNRLLVQSFLKRQPYEIDAAEDGAEAVRKFESRSYDLILMDMQMPVLDGVSATRQIRELETAEQRRRTPIVALTAYALQKEKERSLAAGCDAHLSKPINKRTLLAAIEQYTVMQR